MSILATLSWRTMRAHFGRFLYSIIAVILGTSFVAGAFMLTATLSAAFDDITTASFEGADVVVEGTQDHPLPLSTADSLRARDEVTGVEIADASPIVMLGPDDKPYQSGGAGTWAMPWVDPEDSVTAPAGELEGTAPRTQDEAIINTTAAEKLGVEIGDTVTVITPMDRFEVTISGLVAPDFAVGGWGGLFFDFDTYVARFTDGIHVQTMLIGGEVSVDKLQADYPDLVFESAEKAAEKQSKEIKEQLAFFTYILLAFGAIALLVGTFIISNTFAMIVAQRTREFALLRALGLSRAQLTGQVLGEAIAVGLLGSVLGIGLGVGLVQLIIFALDAVGIGFPTSGISLSLASVLAPLGVGMLITSLASLAAARRAGAVHPVEAMRMGDTFSQTPVRTRGIVGAVLVTLGVIAGLAAAFLTDAEASVRMSLVAVACVAILVGMLAGGALLARHVTGRGLPERATLPRMAVTNLSRNPRRSAATSFALTLGVALVAAISMAGVSMEQSIFGSVREDFKAEAVVAGGMIQVASLPEQAVNDVAAVEGVETVFRQEAAPVVIDGARETASTVAGDVTVTPVTAVDPGTVFEIPLIDGSLSDFSAPGVGMDESTAKKLDVSVGDEVTLVSEATVKTAQAPVVAIWENSDVAGKVFISNAAAEQVMPDHRTWMLMRLFLDFEDDAVVEDVIADLEDAVAPYGILQVQDAEEFAVAGAQQARSLLTVVYALLALSVVIAVLGIVNTLGLSVTERRREFGMLRAVGAQRAQIRRIVTYESVALSVAGGFAGIVAGVFLGWALLRTMAGQGISEIVVPWGSLALVMVAAVIVGIVAAVVPGRMAARTPPLVAVD